MRSHLAIINKNNLNDISSELLLLNGKMKLLPASRYLDFKFDDFRFFCHNYARYGIPTVELIDFLLELIGGRSVIEIGAGSGDLGYHLGIKMTDSKMQEEESIKKFYENMKQPVIKYPDDVEKIEALDAVLKYKPQVVIGSWITTYSPIEKEFNSSPFGIKEKEIFDLVETFIIIGNLDLHGKKPIREYEHELIHAPWIISRAQKPINDCIMIWNKK